MWEETLNWRWNLLRFGRDYVTDVLVERLGLEFEEFQNIANGEFEYHLVLFLEAEWAL